MKLLQILQKCLEDWKNISHLDFCLVNLDNTIYISTCDRALPSEEKLEEFKEDEALCISNMNCRLYKVTESHQLQYILIVWGNSEAASTIGELAVCQIESLLTAYMEKSDKNVFMQNLLLGSYSEVDVFVLKLLRVLLWQFLILKIECSYLYKHRICLYLALKF